MLDPDVGSATLPSVTRVSASVVARRARGIASAAGPALDVRSVVVALHTSDGLAVGEAPTYPGWTAAPDVVQHTILKIIQPLVVGREASLVELAATLQSANVPRAAASAVEMALWDLLGKYRSKPLYGLLGCESPIPLALKHTIGAVTPAAAAKEAERGQSLGIAYFKVKATGDLRHDLARIDAVRSVIDGHPLGIDANGSYELVQLNDLVAALEDREVSFLEQPLPRYHDSQMERIQGQTAIPIVLHESLCGDPRFIEPVKVGYWAISPNDCGGLLGFLDLLAAADSHDVQCLIGAGTDLGISTACLAHLGAATAVANCYIPSDVGGPLYLLDDIVDEFLPLVDGAIAPTSQPGLGVSVPVDSVETVRG